MRLPPSIVLMLADDLGFNDVSFHGSGQIPTPAIDEIAASGLALDNFHAQPVCTPTRASLLSGRHAIHHGIYMPFDRGDARRLNLSYTLLPAALKPLGYNTHAVGKWHLGQNELAALPGRRGFDSYYGYWSGAENYSSHVAAAAYDFASGPNTCTAANGTYSAFAFAARAAHLIATSPLPFFLYVAWQNVHWPLEAPAAYIDRFANTTGGNGRRQAVAAMASVLDDGVRNVTDALKARGLWSDALVLFMSDNGGPTNNNEGTWSSNYPMRGGKNTLWEGGTRVVCAVRGPWVGSDLVGTRSYAPVHVTDWLPTILHAASGDAAWRRALPPDEPPFLDGDGIDVMATLRTGVRVRTELLLETHPRGGDSVHGQGLIVDGWKILHLDGYMRPADEACAEMPPRSRQDAAETGRVLIGPCAQRVARAARTKPGHRRVLAWLRPLTPAARRRRPPPARALQADHLPSRGTGANKSECVAAPCLFHVDADPCEYRNLAAHHPRRLAEISARLAELQVLGRLYYSRHPGGHTQCARY